MRNILFYLQHYLSPSMTFIYRQLSGVKQEFNTYVLCSRIFENDDIFPYDKILFKPELKIFSKISHLKDKLINQSELGSINVNPKLIYFKRKQYEVFLKNKNFNLIHAHFGPSGIEILPLAKKLKLPLLVSFHGYDASSLLKSNIYIENLKKLLQENIYIITPSEYMIKFFHKYNLNFKNEFVVHYGIPLDFYTFQKRQPIFKKFKNNEEIIFLQVANFVEKKGQKYTIQAFKNFIKKYSNSKLILAGEGPLKREMVSLVKDYGICEKVIFPGLVLQDGVRELMNVADVFVHHSITSNLGDMEGIPNVIMEAMATGLPVISTEHSAIPELVENGVNGFLVSEKDIDSYENAMYDILTLDKDFGLNGRRKVEREFNSEIENKKLISIYNKILN